MITQAEFYKSKAWETFRKLVIADRTEDDGFVRCAICGQPIVNKYDLIVHHIEELNDINCNDASIALNPDNVECLHHACHNKEHHRFGHSNYMNKERRVYIVYGPPCSGKMDYVKRMACEADIVVDMDNLWQMVTVNDRYVKPDRLKSIVFDLRDQLYDIIRYRRGRWQNAYVITGGARKGERERLFDRLNADMFVLVKKSKTECLLEAETRPGNWQKYIDDWFETYQAGDEKEK